MPPLPSSLSSSYSPRVRRVLAPWPSPAAGSASGCSACGRAAQAAAWAALTAPRPRTPASTRPCSPPRPGGRVRRAAAGQQVQFAEQLGRAAEQGPAHALVELAAATADGAVADLLVAVADQPIQQLGHPDGGADDVLAFQGVAQGGVEAGGVRQVVT